MKALVFAGKGRPTLEERPKPTIRKPTDAIVKITKTTICGTDLHILKGDVPSCVPGTILGHEGVGIIDEVGDSVKVFKPGDRVIVTGMSGCSMCHSCKKQMPSQCIDGGWTLGNAMDGTQAEYTLVPHADSSLYRMANTASEEAQVMLCDILPTAFECGTLKGQVKAGNTVAIIGGGPVGLSAVLTCQLHSPSRIIVIDLDENRLANALTLGATDIIISGPDTVRQVKELTDGRGVDTVIEAVGIPATFGLCQDIVAPGGNIANIGIHGVKVDLHLEKIWDKNITITTQIVQGVSIPMLAKLVDSRRLQADKMITHRFKFSEIEHAYSIFSNAASHKCLKIIIDF